MFYKHWKKIALALTGFFWASCDNTSSSAEDDPQVSPALYGIEVPCDTGLCSSIPVSSEANGEESSSSFVESSSSFVETSSSFVESSSSYETPVPTYGCGAIECPPSLDLSSSSSIKVSNPSDEEILSTLGCGLKMICHDIPVRDENGNIIGQTGGCNYYYNTCSSEEDE